MKRAGAVIGQTVWRFRYDLLALLIVAAVMVRTVDYLPLQSISGVVPLLGIVVSIFIGFRNRNAYNRWWEARTLWTAIATNGRALNYALLAYEDGTPEMAAITDRMRRREVRHGRQLAAELHDTTAPASLRHLTPEDPAKATATELLSLQAADIGELSRSGLIDRQARRVLVNINSAQVNAAIGLQRIRRQPIPRFYDLFTRALAWFFAIIVCTRLDVGGHTTPVGIALSILIMALVILAERLGHLLEEPMSDDVFGLPLDRYCAQLSTDMLGSDHPAESDEATVSPINSRK